MRFLKYLLGLPADQRKTQLKLKRQGDLTSGLACIAMVLDYYGKSRSDNDICNAFPDRDSTNSLQSIIQFFESQGFHCRPLKCSAEDAPSLRLPAILFWDFNQFALLSHVTPKHYVVYNPASKVEKLTRLDFCKHYSDVALEVYAAGS